jgi:predicted nuclease of predicted toxin-antitoxin system
MTAEAILTDYPELAKEDVLAYAADREYVILSKDDDFLRLQSLLGYPPKIIILKLGNFTNQQIVNALLGSRGHITMALARGDVGVIEVY